MAESILDFHAIFQGSTLHSPSTRAVWLLILASLAVVSLSYGVKNYLAFLTTGTWLCPYLCPSLMGTEFSSNFSILGALFSTQVWLLESAQALASTLVLDSYKLATALVFAPLLEEALYRGPSYLSRHMRSRWLWWLIGSILAVLFALSHRRTGLALFPLICLGFCSLWLISRTQRFWPSLALHFLYNFTYTSAIVYQSIWAAD